MKFEEHEGKLFRMLEEPEPLKEKDTNVLVQFITHGVIGEYVMEHWLDCNQENVPIFVDSVDSDGDVTVCIENGNEHHCCPFPMFEIIGYPVVEGSAEWGLYNAIDGKIVTMDGCGIYKIHDGKLLECFPDDSNEWRVVADDGIRYWHEYIHDKTGWQIYKEPKPEPAKEQFEVGDWVEYRLDGDTYYGKICNIRGYVYYLSVTTEEIPKDQARAIMLESIIRKLAPSQVVITIGCLSGTIRYCLSFGNDGAKHDAIKIFNSNGKSIAVIRLEALDTETRKLVESLLKAMQEDE